jgi:hypothetical protein
MQRAMRTFLRIPMCLLQGGGVYAHTAILAPDTHLCPIGVCVQREAERVQREAERARLADSVEQRQPDIAASANTVRTCVRTGCYCACVYICVCVYVCMYQ